MVPRTFRMNCTWFELWCMFSVQREQTSPSVVHYSLRAPAEVRKAPPEQAWSCSTRGQHCWVQVVQGTGWRTLVFWCTDLFNCWHENTDYLVILVHDEESSLCFLWESISHAGSVNPQYWTVLWTGRRLLHELTLGCAELWALDSVLDAYFMTSSLCIPRRLPTHREQYLVLLRLCSLVDEISFQLTSLRGCSRWIVWYRRYTHAGTRGKDTHTVVLQGLRLSVGKKEKKENQILYATVFCELHLLSFSSGCRVYCFLL